MAKSKNEIEDVKEEILEHVRLLAEGKVQTVYQIIEKGKELIRLETNAGTEPEREPVSSSFPPGPAPKKKRGTIEKEDF